MRRSRPISKTPNKSCFNPIPGAAVKSYLLATLSALSLSFQPGWHSSLSAAEVLDPSLAVRTVVSGLSQHHDGFPRHAIFGLRKTAMTPSLSSIELNPE
jgi:hypothetical protein